MTDTLHDLEATPRFVRDVPYVPTDEQVALAMLRLAHVEPKDVVYDLGCGDGRIVLTAVRHCGARGVGIEVDPQRLRECDENLRHLPPGDRRFAEFRRASFFEVDLTPATVVTLYLLPKINMRLRPKLLWELRPGTRIIANTFGMGEWEPDQRVETHGRTLFRWIVPAWVQGTWRCVIEAPPGLGGRRRMALDLERRFQHLTGQASIEGKRVPIGAGVVCGHRVRFHIPDPSQGGRGMDFVGEVAGGSLRGTWTFAGGETGPWGGRRA